MVEAIQTASTSQAPDTPINEVYVSKVSTADLEELCMLDSVAVSILKQADSIRKHISNTAKGKPMPTPATQSAVKAGKASLIPTFSHTLADTQSSPTSSQSPPFAPVPSFSTHTRWRSNIEDPDVIQHVIDKSLGSTVTLTHRELYAISSNTCQYLKDNVTTRKVPILATASTNAFEEVEKDNAPVETFLQSISLPSNLIVRKSIVELRAISLRLEGHISVEAVLDEGSQVIGLRRDIWEKLGLPIYPEQTMVMQSANKSCNTTMGLLLNLRVTIGNCDFYLQVQVIDNTFYEMLHGRPFLTLAQANTRHFSNGDSHITLVDPNSQAVITIPTQPRNRSSSNVSAASGFQ